MTDYISRYTGHHHGVKCPNCESQATAEAEKFPAGYLICKDCGILFVRGGRNR